MKTWTRIAIVLSGIWLLLSVMFFNPENSLVLGWLVIWLACWLFRAHIPDAVREAKQ